MTAFSARKAERQRQNAKTALQFFIVLTTVIAGLGLYSRSLDGDSDAVLTLEASSEHSVGTEARTDPLALCTDKSSFELLAMNSDQSVIGYCSKLPTGQAALSLIERVSGRGWQMGGLTGAESESESSVNASINDLEQNARTLEPIASPRSLESRTGAFALVFTSDTASLGGYSQMMVQLFPVVDGCSIVVRLY
jgi:hypothetical protein